MFNLPVKANFDVFFTCPEQEVPESRGGHISHPDTDTFFTACKYGTGIILVFP